MQTTQPKGIYFLSSVEMWERFSYYGLRALLSLFLISVCVGYNKAEASKLFGWFISLVYVTPILGGYIADRFIGKRYSITIGAIITATGQFVLAAYEVMPAKLSLFLGLLLVIIGTGFIKPNISAMVGELYELDDRRRDKGFAIFYVGINIGSALAPLICGYLGQGIAWKYGFMAAGCGMLLGMVIYLCLGKRYLGDIGLRPVHKMEANPKTDVNQSLSKKDWDKIKAICTFTFFAALFWAFYEQAGASLTFFAEEATTLPVVRIFGQSIQIRSSFLLSIAPLFVLILAPLSADLWSFLRKKSQEPSIPTKFGWGLFLQGIAFSIMIVGSAVYLKAGPVSMVFLILTYFFCTLGEVCLSPIGLSTVTKLSPPKLVGMMMGIWFISNFIGGKLAGILSSFYDELQLTTLFSIPAICSIVFAVFIWLLSKKIKLWMHGVE